MKKINKNGTVVSLIKLGYGFACGIGSMAAFDAVVVPFINAVWGNHRHIRRLAFLGTHAIGVAIGGIGLGSSEEIFDAFVDGYNLIADGVNGLKDEKNDILAEDHEDADYEESDELTEAIANSKVFEFKSEMMARGCIGETNALWKSPSIFDFAVTRSKFDISWAEKHFDKIKDVEEAKIYGWPNGLVGAEIEKVNDNVYFVDLLDYEIVPEKVNYYKDSDMNTFVPRKEN